MRLLIVERFHTLKQLRQFDLMPPDVDTLITYGTGLWRPSLPKITFSDIPFTGMPVNLRPQSFKPSNFFQSKGGQVVFTVSQDASMSEHKQVLDSFVEYLSKKMPLYDEIICVLEQDRRAFGSVKQLFDKLGECHATPINYFFFPLIDPESAKLRWDLRSNNVWDNSSIAHKLAKEQQAKNTFDFWWNSNASLVLSELCKWSGLAADPIMSKYELMLANILFDQKEALTSQTMMEIMASWQGTGKYKTNSQYSDLSIGSAMSRGVIIDTALKRGLVLFNNDKYSISEEGIAFVSSLHKKTFDKDLPFRLNQWICEDDYNGMMRYIKTIFGRQLKYQRKGRLFNS